MILHQNQLSLSVGAWVGANTDPASAFRETLLKAKGGWESLQSFSEGRKVR
jgi:hypothetical protein